MVVRASKTFRIGRQILWQHKGQWYVSIQNRTYASIVLIPEEKVEEWRKILD